MRFFSWSLGKSVGYFVGNLGVAASLATSEISSHISAISGGIGLLGNTLNFTAENSENLAIDQIGNQYYVLLEKQLESNGFSLEDCRDEFPWSSYLKKADELLKKKIPYFCTIVDAAFGTIGGILCLAVNADKDESTKNEDNASCSVLAGICIGIQCFIHYFTSRQLNNIRQEITALRRDLTLLAQNERFLLWKFTLLKQKSLAILDKLRNLEEMRSGLAETQVRYQTELEQERKTLNRIREEYTNITNKLDAIEADISVKTEQLLFIESSAILTDKTEQQNGTLRSVLDNLTGEQINAESLLQKLQVKSRSVDKDITNTEKKIGEVTENMGHIDTEVIMMKQQQVKLGERVIGLHLQLEERFHQHEAFADSLRITLGQA